MVIPWEFPKPVLCIQNEQINFVQVACVRYSGQKIVPVQKNSFGQKNYILCQNHIQMSDIVAICRKKYFSKKPRGQKTLCCEDFNK